jgi:outer membrane lipoprotein-sorting protein
MRRLFGILATVAAAGFVLAQSGSNLISGFTKALHEAQSLSTTFSVQVIGDAPTVYNLDLAKPNLARIDTPTQLIVADGKNITTYEKGPKTYYKRAQTAEELKALFASYELSVWSGFFDSAAFSKVASTKSLGTKNRKGMNLAVVEAALDAGRTKTMTLYINPADNVARQAEFVVSAHGEKETAILDTRSLSLNNKGDASLFAFNAPDGARELSLEELNSAQWYTDLEEAKKVAARTNRLLLVDFYADW